MSEPYLPAVGYATPRDPRWRHRWQKLLRAMSSAGVDVREWPYRAEGADGKLQAIRWLTLWQVQGEGAVLDELEQGWAEHQRPPDPLPHAKPGPPKGSYEFPRPRIVEAAREAMKKERRAPSWADIAKQLEVEGVRPSIRQLQRVAGPLALLQDEAKKA